MVTQIGRLETPVSFPKQAADWHSFLDGWVTEAYQIRQYVEGLPETRATWKLADVDGIMPRQIDPSIVKLTGAWLVPDVLDSGSVNRWVNPNYVHAQHYSDVVVRCGCGIPVLRQSFSEKEKQPAHHQEHNKDCTKIHRKKTELELLKNRRDIIKDAYAHGHSATGISQRLGYPEGHHIGGGEVNELGEDMGKLATQGRKKVARTALVLCREHSPETVAALFGLHRKSLSEMVTKETVSDASVLYSVRRSPNTQ